MSGTTQKYNPDADLSNIHQPKPPTLKMCTMTAGGHLTIPEQERKKWLSDPVRSSLKCCSCNFCGLIVLLEHLSICNVFAT